MFALEIKVAFFIAVYSPVLKVYISNIKSKVESHSRRKRPSAISGLGTTFPCFKPLYISIIFQVILSHEMVVSKP